MTNGMTRQRGGQHLIALDRAAMVEWHQMLRLALASSLPRGLPPLLIRFGRERLRCAEAGSIRSNLP
jgi:hypothetical protein